MDPLNPPATVLIKLGSIAVHVEELFSPTGDEQFDLAAIDQLLADPEVKEWMSSANALALLPVKR